MRDVVVVSAARTPFGKMGGRLSSFQAVELGGIVIKEALKRANITGDQLDQLIFGNVISAGEGQVPARQAAYLGGVPYTCPSFSVNKVCASALKAIELGVQMIKAEDADIVLCGGMESMSNAPYLLREARSGARMGNIQLEDAMIKDALLCPENKVHMAVIGGQVASENNITREMQDKWALRSQQRWAMAEDKGLFDVERVPVEVRDKRGNVSVVAKDEGPRPDASLEQLSKLKPLFTPDNTITAGNAPSTNDGATAIILMSREKAVSLGAPILASIKGYVEVGREPRYIATVPGIAIEKLMKKNQLTLDDFDLIEINEAFAAVPLTSCIGVLKMSPEEMDAKVNVNGSAVACGHPVGASGARILMTLIFELRRRNQKSGVCAICSGMGQGDAVWVEIE